MSAFPFANIRVIAEASKCPPVSDDVCQVLAADLEYRIREIAQVINHRLTIFCLRPFFITFYDKIEIFYS